MQCIRQLIPLPDGTLAPDKTGFNDFPYGWKRVTKIHWLTLVNMPSWMEYRQMMVFRNPDGSTKKMIDPLKPIHAYLFWFSDHTGCAFSRRRNGKTMRFYRFGCEHKYIPISRETTKDNENDHFVCEKCKHQLITPRTS